MSDTATTPRPVDAVLRRMFEIVTLIKLTDERFRSLIGRGAIRVTYYSPRGQEIISAAFGTELRSDDYMVTTYRGLHDHLAKGVPPKDLWAEFLGRITGTCKGKGGPMHITDPRSGLMVTTGIVGSGLPIANGLALASQLRGTDQVTVVNFGDGASNIGAFHEALNLASLWRLPVVFVCQNNRYAEHTPFAFGTAARQVSDRGVAYAMPAVTVDGNDPIEMHRVATEAIGRARRGEGPTLVEAMTYRFFGHINGDPMEYMPAEERAAAIDADPVPRFRTWLLEHGICTEADLADIEATATVAIDEAVSYAMESPPPALDELWTDVLAGSAR